MASARVRHRDQTTPAARIAAVTDRETAGGTYSIPSSGAANTLAPMKTSRTANACFK